MKTAYLDANVLLRLATRVPEDLFQRALARVRLAEARGERLLVHPIHVATAVYVLKGYYQYPLEKVRQVLGVVLGLRAVSVIDEPLVLEALEVMVEKNVDFDDAYLALRAASEGAAVLSFDRDFGRLTPAWEVP